MNTSAPENPQNYPPKPFKRFSVLALVFSTIVLGFVAGLGGSMLLSHSLIQLPLQQQQAFITGQYEKHQQQLAVLNAETLRQNAVIDSLREEIRLLIHVDSRGNLKKLAEIQNEYAQREKTILLQLTQLEQKLSALEKTNQDLNKAVDEAKREVDASDNALRDDLRQMRSALNDLQNKLQQMERQASAR